jgi:preprotein translocase subunit SecD
MVDNIWNKVALILAVTIGALILFGVIGIKKGLDLSGGARLAYKLDIDKAIAEGQIDAATPRTQVFDETITILTDRIDPTGALDVSIQKQGTDRLLVEVPGENASEIEEVKRRIQQLGKLEWILVVDESQEDYDLQGEKKRLEEWLKKPANQAIVGRNPLDISIFNALPFDEGGPLRGRDIKWVPMHENADTQGNLEVKVDIEWTDSKGKPVQGWTTSKGEIHQGPIRFMPLNNQETETIMKFSGEDLSAGSIKQTQDPNTARPAVEFAIRPSRKADFARFTEAHVESPFAIILNQYCRSAPVIQDRLPGRGIITLGNIKGDEVQQVVKLLEESM